MDLLRYVSGTCGLVCGSETGHDAAVPFVDYFEGMLSLGPYRVQDAGRDMMRPWNDVPEAVAKYRESLGLVPDPELARYVQTLEGGIAKGRQLRAQGEAQQREGKIAEAIASYRQSLTLIPDKALEEHVRVLEARLASTPVVKPQPPPPAAGGWRGVGTGDCPGRDVAGSREPAPDPSKCTAGFVGFTAVCWNDGCTYKNVPTGQCTGGIRPGRMYTCAAQAAPVAAPSGEVIFNNGNTAGVFNVPTAPTVFTLSRPYRLTYLMTYHWNNGLGKAGGSIGLRAADGRMYGPWGVNTAPGQGGVPNVYWQARPNLVVPAATYTIVDSDPTTWAQNAGSGGRGLAEVRGEPQDAGGSGAGQGGRDYTSIPRTPQPAPTSAAVSAEITNRSKANTHIFAGGDTFGPANRFAPGETRRVRVTMQPNGAVTFTAGRDGQVLATKTWHGDPGSPSRVPVVIFDDSNPYEKLTVSTGLR
ncbi:MAG: hypothetical protein WCI75_20330, partial [candidate division NC10 bacterium]